MYPVDSNLQNLNADGVLNTVLHSYIYMNL